jgi:hypothetical protein
VLNRDRDRETNHSLTDAHSEKRDSSSQPLAPSSQSPS